MKINSRLNEKIPPIKFVIGAVLALVIFSYGLYEAHDLIFGPSLEITSPLDGATTNDPYISIKGSAQRISKIIINGRQIFTKDNGYFDEPLLLGYGYNIIEVKVEDQFGRGIEKTMRVVLE